MAAYTHAYANEPDHRDVLDDGLGVSSVKKQKALGQLAQFRDPSSIDTDAHEMHAQAMIAERMKEQAKIDARRAERENAISSNGENGQAVDDEGNPKPLALKAPTKNLKVEPPSPPPPSIPGLG